MKVKGIAVKSTYDFVKKNYPDRLQEWLKNLPDNSKKIFRNPILPSEYYPIEDAVIMPTRLVGDMFVGSAEKAAMEIGAFAAREAFKGVYKIFVRMASINYIIKRSQSIYNNYYDTGKFQIITNQKGSAVMKLSGIPQDYYLVIHRIASWIFEIPVILNKRPKRLDLKKLQIDNLIDAYFYLDWYE